MPDKRNAIREAHLIHKEHHEYDARRRDEAIALLVSHGSWSNRNIQSITGATPWHVQKIAKKTDKRGGKLNPDSLGVLETIIRNKDKGELNKALFVQVVTEHGTSPYLVSTLTGYAVTSVKRYAGLVDAEAA